jgi:hypothetical protein
MKFGNWNITGSEIAWSGNDGNSFVINRATLLETEMLREDTKMYSWLVQATDEEWLTEDALYDLNFAFVFVAGQNPDKFDYEILEDTLDYQYEAREGDEEDVDDDEDEDDDED